VGVKSASSVPPTLRFGVFELDARAGELRKKGMKIRLQGQPVDILVMLLERPGETITREELQKKLWPADTFVDFEQGLNNAMKRLRAALDDSAESPRFVETLPRRGYRFIAALDGIPLATEQQAGHSVRTGKAVGSSVWRESFARLWTILQPASRGAFEANRWLLVISVLCVIALAGVFTWVMRSRHPILLSELKQKQLTSNSVGNAVVSGAISPDGKYLAYVDPVGVHVQLVANGDMQTVSQPESLNANAAWSIASWLPDNTSFLANAAVPGGSTSIWVVSLLGRAPKKIRDDATAWSVSPDGSKIAFTAVPGLFGSREIWLMTKEGEQARKLFPATDENSGVTRVAWSPNGNRVGYLKFHQMSDRFEISIETRDLTGGPPTMLLTSRLLHDFYWLPDGRVVYSIGEVEATASDNCNLWEAQVNAATGARLEQPRRLTNWAGSNVDHLSATSDGKRLVFQKSSNHANIHIGELRDKNTKLTPPQKLTLSEALNFPTTWTSDSKAVIFLSDRNGHWGMYKQKLNRDPAETLLTADTYLPARTSSDGRWILFYSIPNEGTDSPDAGSSTPLQLMRIPITGGPPELLISA
jgi:DNA-binding winged helix-turn-helix (wHTH) protein/Tol biopolymer transport system component